MPHVTLSLAPPAANLGDFETLVRYAITDGRGHSCFSRSFLVTTPERAIASGPRRNWSGRTTGLGVATGGSRDKGLAGLTLAMQPGRPLSGRVEFRTDSGPAAQPSQRQVLTLQPRALCFWRSCRP